MQYSLTWLKYSAIYLTYKKLVHPIVNNDTSGQKQSFEKKNSAAAYLYKLVLLICTHQYQHMSLQFQ